MPGLQLIPSTAPILAHTCDIFPPQWACPELCQPCRQLFAHPGEVEAARLSAEETQRQVLKALPEEAQDRVKIVGTVCTDFTTFTYNQPAIVSLPGLREACFSYTGMQQPCASRVQWWQPVTHSTLSQTGRCGSM